jgi:hypothetical protein
MLKRLTATKLWIGYAITALWAVAVRILGGARFAAGMGPGGILPFRPLAWAAGNIVADGLAFYLALQVRSDYPRGSRMRTAWLLVALSAFCAMVRYLAQWVTVMTAGPLALRGTAGAATQLPELLHLVLLVGGLGMMWSCFGDLGLRVWPRAGDWVWIAAIVALMAVVAGLRETAAPVDFAAPIIRRLEELDPILIGALAVAAVVLARVSREIGGGETATSLRYIALLALVRFAPIVIRLWPGAASHEALVIPVTAAGLASDWLFALVIFHRWHFTRTAAALADRYEQSLERLPKAS